MSSNRKVITAIAAYVTVGIFSSSWTWNHVQPDSWQFMQSYLSFLGWPLYWAFKAALLVTRWP